MLTGFIIGISMGSSLDLSTVPKYRDIQYTVSMNGYEKILPVPVSV